MDFTSNTTRELLVNESRFNPKDLMNINKKENSRKYFWTEYYCMSAYLWFSWENKCLFEKLRTIYDKT